MDARETNVLLVDDEHDFREATASLLREQGWGCDTAGNAVEAREMLEIRSYDVVVADLRMQGNEELQLVEWLSSSKKQPATILITGFPSIDTAVRAVNLRLAAYLVKPFEFEQLRARIEMALRWVRESEAIESTQAQIAAARNALDRAGRLLGGAPTEAAASSWADTGDLCAERPQLRWLTERERELVGQLLEGYRVSTIAETLHISPHTVRRHLKSIFLKLEVRSQAELLEKLKPPRPVHAAGG